MKFAFLIAALISISYFIGFIHPGEKESKVFPSARGKILYTDVSITNLPVSVVSGPGMDVEAADLDNDGDLDIVIANEYQPNKMLLNNGLGVFTDGTPGRLPQKFLDSEDIGIADMDSDNDLDIVFATEDHTIHELYFNNGNAVFRDMQGVLPNSRANSVLAADVNNDSLPDIILGNAGPGDSPAQNFILINNGDSTFTNETTTRMPNVLDITQDIKLADIDNDGDKDMIVGNEDGNRIHINNGSGVFTDETSTRLPVYGDEETRKVTLADIDNDNDLDIFFANVAFRAGMNRQDRLLKNNGSGVFTDVTATNIPPDNEHTTEGIFVDVDYDGYLDLVTANIFFNRPVKVFINDGTGIFGERTADVLPPGIAGEGIGVIATDLNGDHLPDLYIVNRGQMDRLLFRNDTTGTIGIKQTGNKVPESFVLYQNYPNPFNPATRIRFAIPPYKGLPAAGREAEDVSLIIFDILGREVMTLVNEPLSPGTYEVDFDASNLNSAAYFYRLETGSLSQTKKMILLK